MRRLGTEGWAGVAMLFVAVAVSLPVLIGPVDLRVPRPLWAALLLVCFGAMLATEMLASHRRAGLAALWLAVVSAWAVVLTVPTMGLQHVLVVITAALSVSVVTLPVSLVIVALNTTVVLGVNLWVSTERAEALILAGFYLLIQLASVFSTATLLREMRMRSELAQAHVELKTAGILLAESARTAERLRISRELHDLIGHQLAVLTLNIEAARHLEPKQARQHIDRADAVARTLLQDVRSTVGRLRTEPVDIEGALRSIVEGIPGLDVEISVDPCVELGEEQSVAFLRLAQEAVTNTIRHSEAAHLDIDLSRGGGEVRLSVTDDGVGSARPEFGNGLCGLQERFEALGGELDVDGRNGFTVTGRMAAA